MNDNDLQDNVKKFKALGHPSRLRIVDLLNKKGVLCVCDITELMGFDISTISKHLRVLKTAGLVCATKKGNMILYESLIPCLSDLIDCFSRIKHARQLYPIDNEKA